VLKLHREVYFSTTEYKWSKYEEIAMIDMPTVRIACDCDGPLVEDRTMEWFDWVINVLEVKTWDYEEFVRRGFIAGTAEEKSVVNERYAEYRLSRYFDGDAITAGAITAMRRLSGVGKAVVTARAPTLIEETKMLLRTSFGARAFLGWYFDVSQKVGVLDGNGFGFFIEDSDDQARMVADTLAQVRVYLFPRRGIVRKKARGAAVLLEAEKKNSPDIDDMSWKEVCESAWEQIADDILCQLVNVK